MTNDAHLSPTLLQARGSDAVAEPGHASPATEAICILGYN